ncbi:NAD(+)/NADH kinase [Candidatus Carsonella ruddii]|uniref:Valyl-tRNA synthetase n=1 Tax=Carsonella ruddii TaxID=114186 RepID=A0A1U9RRV9_CARRU|nr:NAD(+)/NADH kinase [Candidatus Carsonella ruddii]AQU89519.1 Valyl-tRNA synthetase [Candidatus Carsonella ruddii]
MKNFLIKIRYGINNKNIFILINKLIKKRKNIFFSIIIISNNFIYNVNFKKNLFLCKNYLFFKILLICGGDGSIISIFKYFYNKKIFIKCFNFGNLGFLTNNYFKKNFILTSNIGNILIFKNKIKFSLLFINEVLIKNKNLKIKIKNNIYYSDMILISSENGSTGYMFSNIKIQFKINYLSFSLVLSHTNNNVIFFFKKIKIKIYSNINLTLDCVQKFFLKNIFLIILIKPKKIFLNDLFIKIYDK